MLLRLLALAAVVSAELPSVYRRPTFAVNVTSDVPYASTLVNCTNKTDASTCAEESVLLDAHAPSLQPHLMYLTHCTSDTMTCGRPDALTRWMTRHGVRVHFWRLSFWKSLPESARRQRNQGTLNSWGT